MPRENLVEGNRASGQVTPFPALTWTTKGECQRIFAGLETQVVDGRRVAAPWSEWTHTLKAPKIMDGQALRVKRTGRDGTETWDWDLDFFGQPLCLGDKDALKSKGADFRNCPVCEGSRSDPQAFPAPVIRYSMNVLRYATRPGSFDVIAPFSAQILVWKFTAARFDALLDIQKELSNGQLPDGRGGYVTKDFQLTDLRLGPCEDVRYQKYKIASAEGLAVCRASREHWAYVQQLWSAPEGHATDEQLQAACGRRVVNRAFLEEDMARCKSAWAVALNHGAAPTHDPFGALSGSRGQEDMAAGMADLAASVSAAGGIDALNYPPAPHPGGLDEFMPAVPTSPPAAPGAAVQTAPVAAAGGAIQTTLPASPAPAVPALPAVPADPFAGLEPDLPPAPAANGALAQPAAAGSLDFDVLMGSIDGA